MIEEKLKWPLFILRVGIFIVMFIWTLDKFVRPEHTSAVFQKFYLMPALSNTISYFIGAIQSLVVFGFIIGFKKKFTYGTILILHSVSTLSSYSQYFHPWDGAGILFFAAWPMLASIIALYKLRSYDTLFAVN
ncbi:MAG: hypothetical protein HOJ35_12335 [Bdellovibrionales bacterium]|jgi:putative oxidoreductase|nr:hypothetical protein [Bdellovibrionales bacterium]